MTEGYMHLEVCARGRLLPGWSGLCVQHYAVTLTYTGPPVMAISIVYTKQRGTVTPVHWPWTLDTLYVCACIQLLPRPP